MTIKILYLDDNPNGFQLLILGLKNNGFDVSIVSTYEDAVEIHNSAAEFDVYLLDLQLGGAETGMDFADKLRDDGCRKPIVIYTSAPEKAIGRDDVIVRSKAENTRELIDLLKQIA
ncbi:MAG: response regulator [Candidatus Thiodiazotropha sp.]|nr:response regulator [Candidatus Thiodiazotropha sp.]